MGDSIGDMNLFMMCRSLNAAALTPVPDGYHARYCRTEELTLWMDMPFDDPAEALRHRGFMENYFQTVYQPKGDQFFQRCVFLCDTNDAPVGTCFVWRAYDAISTVHWLKVKKSFEGGGLGRALLTLIMKNLSEREYPVYLHTHPPCTRAIKLYSDFGFALLTDSMIGNRVNHLKECLLHLQAELPPDAFCNLRFETAPQAFLDAAASSTIDQF